MDHGPDKDQEENREDHYHIVPFEVRLRWYHSLVSLEVWTLTSNSQIHVPLCIVENKVESFEEGSPYDNVIGVFSYVAILVSLDQEIAHY